jgi:hypothetical protein
VPASLLRRAFVILEPLGAAPSPGGTAESALARTHAGGAQLPSVRALAAAQRPRTVAVSAHPFSTMRLSDAARPAVASPWDGAMAAQHALLARALARIDDRLEREQEREAKKAASR